MSNVLRAQNLKLNNVTFSETKPLSIPGAKLAYINLNGGKIVVQGPKMQSRFGIRRWLNEENGKYDYDIELSFDENSQDLLQKNKELDEIIKKQIKAKSKEWLGKPSISDELLNDKYKPIVKLNERITLKNGEIKDFPPSFVLKLAGDQESNKFQSSKDIELLFFDSNKNKMDVNLDDFVKNGDNKFDVHRLIAGNTCIIPVYEVSFLSFTKTSIKPRLKLVQAKVFPNTANVINSYIMEDDEEFEEDLDTEGEAEKNVDVDMEEELEEELESELEEELESEEVVEKPPVKRGRGKKLVL